MFSAHHTQLMDHAFSARGQLICQRAADMDMKGWLKRCYQALDMSYPKFHKMDEQCRVGVLLAEPIMAQVSDMHAKVKTGVFLINRSASIYTDSIFYNSYTKESASPARFVYTLPNIVIGEIAIRYKLLGEHGFFIMDEIDSESLYLYVDSLLTEEVLDAALLGVVDVSRNGIQGAMCYLTRDVIDEGAELDAQSFNQWINTILRTQKTI